MERNGISVSTRLVEGKRCADTLVGMDRGAAVLQAHQFRFVTEELPMTVAAVNADLHPDRIRIFYDATGRVVQARAG
jgi:hypothetical protein